MAMYDDMTLTAGLLFAIIGSLPLSRVVDGVLHAEAFAFPLYNMMLTCCVALAAKSMVLSLQDGFSVFLGLAQGLLLPAALAHLHYLLTHTQAHTEGGSSSSSSSRESSWPSSPIFNIAGTREYEVLPFLLCIGIVIDSTVARFGLSGRIVLTTSIGVCFCGMLLEINMLWLVMIGVMFCMSHGLRTAASLSHFEFSLLLYGLGALLADVTCPHILYSSLAENTTQAQRCLRVAKLGIICTIAFGLVLRVVMGRVNIAGESPFAVFSTISILAGLGIATLVFVCCMLAIMHLYLRRNPLVWVWELLMWRSTNWALALRWCLLLAAITPVAKDCLLRWKWHPITTRKIFHILAVVMFVPPLLEESGMSDDSYRGFLALAMAVALCAFLMLEYARALTTVTGLGSLLPVLEDMLAFLGQFEKPTAEGKSRKAVIWDHITLLLGCAVPIWLSLSSPSSSSLPLLPFIGLISVGVGDTVAAIVGISFGRHRWTPSSGRTLEGSAAAALFMLLTVRLLQWYLGGAQQEMLSTTIMVTMITIVEAFTSENDNLVVALHGVLCYVALALLELRLREA